ncbi:MAG: (d)CMP kinase [Coriobacteriales bacterium]|jgi:cytidylate kinase
MDGAANIIVAIDGPAGSGKSTIARLLSRRHGFTYLDTGAMYRAVAWRALRLGVPVEDEAGVSLIAQSDPIEFGEGAYGQTVSIAGCDVTDQIRTPEVDAAVSSVARIPAVREEMVRAQRAIAGQRSVVCEGRDIGTVVFPQAQVKVFLTASPQMRARRRARQNASRGMQGASVDEAAILEGIVKRDETDSHREVAPLRAADDAVRIDTSSMSIDEVVAAIDRLIDQARQTGRG